MIDLVVRNVRIEGEPALVDLAVKDGAIVERGVSLNVVAAQEIAGDGRLLIPGFVESHLHLDIALMNDWQTPGRPEPYLSHYGLNQSVERRRRDFTPEDIERRASAALELASRHGVTALRAQCHVDREVGLKHVEALQRVKEKYAGRVTVQIVTFPQQGLINHPDNAPLFREAFRIGADVMGGASNLDVMGDGRIDWRAHIDAAFDLAMELDVDLDIHADLSIPQSVTFDELETVYIAQQTIERGYQGRVTVGHACTLGVATPKVAAEAIALIREANLNIISQPDLYRLGRDDTHNVRRGLTRVKELLAAGVNVTYASNNVRDALRPMGNFDLLEEGLILAYGAHMDTVEEFNTILRMSTVNAARALRLPHYGLQPGCTADFVILDAPTPSAAIVGQAEKAYVVKNGRIMATNQTISHLYQGTLAGKFVENG
ncbi:amidohydrolase family protein [Aggregatilinea lenta]|uniref:amidohydrolase family protein n=1 Tax=Aggregatilinea lenta TaxID=913108 RepID=UPI000E5C20F8|nr:amidohydrolase family protein [Aggregatilinea lenta]